MSIPINFQDTSQKKCALIYKVKLAVLLHYTELNRDFKELKLNEKFMNEVKFLKIHFKPFIFYLRKMIVFDINLT